MSRQIYMQVGPASYHILTEEEFFVDETCRQFFYEKAEDMKPETKSGDIISCRIRRVSEFTPVCGELVYENPERQIFRDEQYETRVFYWCGQIYGICREDPSEKLEIELAETAFPELALNMRVIEMMSLEKALLSRQAMVLHSAFIAWKNQGIVFTAPSGTGKSTQAELWRKYASAHVVNGDRSVLWWREETQQYEVCGLPFCGSSQINYNEQYPLRAVVFISQAPENHVQEYPIVHAVRKLFGEISINQWDSTSVQMAFDQIERLAGNVRMVQLECNMEPEAVETLREYIR